MIVFLIVIGLMIQNTIYAQANINLDAKKILKEAEKIRSLENAQIKVKLSNVGQDNPYLLDILRSTGQKAYVDFLEPDVEAGRKILAIKRNYWTKFPKSKRVVPISKKEMLGNSAFSIADLFQLNADEDYDPQIMEQQTIAGKKIIKLKLTAKHRDAPYELVYYYVEEQGYFPIKAEFMGISGKLLKTMTVEKRKQLGGRLRPQTLKMIDEVTRGKVSVWETLSMTARSVPTNVFTQDYIKSQN